MKKSVALVVTILVIVLSSCSKAVEYNLDELLPPDFYVDINIIEGVYRNDLLAEGYLLGETHYEETIDSIDYEYVRYISMNDDFIQHIADLSKLVESNFSDIEDAFKKAEDIGYIVLNTELGILSILPYDLTKLTNRNSVIININEFLEEDDFYELASYKYLGGFNLRNMFVSQFNIEYSANSIKQFRNYLSGTNGFLSNNIAYFDILVTNNIEQHTSYIYLYDDYPMLGNMSQQLPIEQIPIKFTYTNFDKDDILVKSDKDLIIRFYSSTSE